MSSSGQAYINHQLNASKSKEVHVFSKAHRFPSLKITADLVYSIPSTQTKRSTSFGYGSKTQFVDKKVSPPPGSYRLQSDFEKKDLSGVTSIGPGREKVTFGSFLLEALKRNRDNPSPDRYNIQNAKNRTGGHMGERIKTEPNAKQTRNIPGPGTYKISATEISSQGCYVLSNYKNVASPRYFSANTFEHKDLSNHRHSNSVIYEVQEKQVGRYSNSRYKNVPTRSFGRSRRPGMEDRSKLAVPGFKYRRFSQFGGAFV